MKTIFVKASALQDVSITKAQTELLPKPVGLVTTVQHEHKLAETHKQIPSSIVGGVILGCNVSNAMKIGKRVKSYLFLGTGTFHPLMIALETAKLVYVLNPADNNISEVDEREVQRYRQKKKANYMKFLHASSVGILVSTKPGQQNLRKAISLSRHLKKRSYILLADSIDTNSLRNFPFVDCFVNAACPRLVEDSEVPVINIDEIT